uniref:Bax inhibitor 1 n=1 Tax=Rhabditophanes sp. KR3021 TaxID=114890 RepID=A0AC35TG36_9BILA
MPNLQKVTNSVNSANTKQQPSQVNIESGESKHLGFNELSIRAGFMRKVFSLVTIMLAVVGIMSSVPFFSNDLYDFIQQRQWMYWASFGIFICSYLILMCVPTVRVKFPLNIIALSIFTLATGYMVMMVCTNYAIISIVLAFVITTASTAAVTLFALQTKYDLTSKIGYIFMASVILFCFGVTAPVAIFAYDVTFLNTIYAGVGALLSMVYLCLDIQLIMGNKKYNISPEDYVFAALQLFMDIINMFLMILRIVKK